MKSDRDAFEAYVLHSLARTEALQWLDSLRGVCRQWRTMLGRVTHLNLVGGTGFSCSMREHLLRKRYPLVCSLRAHRSVMTYPGYSEISFMTRITALEVTEAASDDTREWILTLRDWSALRTLVLPAMKESVAGLAKLTGLTSLDISLEDTIDVRHHKLCRLTGLQSLRLRGFLYNMQQWNLPRLTWLDSDEAAHFLGYTGAGRLEDADDWEDGARDAFDAFEPGCSDVRARGTWTQGRFSGWMQLQHGDDGERWYSGGYVDNRRAGQGWTTDLTTQRIYVGGWQAGARHGLGAEFSWRDQQAPPARAGLTLEALGRWARGEAQACYYSAQAGCELGAEATAMLAELDEWWHVHRP